MAKRGRPPKHRILMEERFNETAKSLAERNDMGELSQSVDFNERDEINSLLEQKEIEEQHEESDENEHKVSDENWTEYVIGQMHKNELSKDGLPKVCGLSRVLSRVGMGKIKSIKTTVHSVPSFDYRGAATTVKLVVEKDHEEYVVHGSSHCDERNSKSPYLEHALATAESKALGKALRQYLQLTILSAEEVESQNEEMFNTGLSKLSTAQSSAIDTVSQRANVCVSKLIHSIFEKKVTSVDQLSSEDGVIILRSLSSYQNSEVPEDIKGYKSTWRQDLGRND